MSSAEATTAWARALADELARAGVREVVVAPGSRSTPLVLAFAADGRFRVRVHLDERSAGFFALGVGKASGMPAAVVTTSGTATANLYGAVIEAAQAEVPLLILTADRPLRLRGADANQAIDQTRLYGPYVRAFFEAAPPERDDAALRHLRALACRAVLAAREAPAGPVHLNLPFDKPLEPPRASAGEDRAAIDAFAAAHPLAAGGREDGRPWVDVTPTRRRATAEVLEPLRALCGGLGRGVVVAGPSSDPARDGPAAVAFAAATGFPLLADPLSGARWGPVCRRAGRGGVRPVPARRGGPRAPDARADRARRRQPDLCGAAGVARAPRRRAPRGGGRRRSVEGPRVRRLRLRARGCGGYAVRASWPGWSGASTRVGPRRGGRRARRRARRSTPTRAAHPTRDTSWARWCGRCPRTPLLFVSSSMPVRDLDAFGAPREEGLRAYGNRGASGIDGIVSTAFGVAAASAAPVVCVLGDVALFHDQNGLLWQREADAPVVFVLVDNDGGGIFHMLPVREHEPWFTPYFATPHGLDLRHAAAMHGIPFEDAEPAGLSGALAAAIAEGRTRVVRVRTEREANRRRHAEVAEAVARSVRAALG